MNIIHRLVEENKRLKHKMEDLEDKENVPQEILRGKMEDKNRIEELEDCVI